MSASGFVVAVVRLCVLAFPAALVVSVLRRQLTTIRGVEAALVDTVGAVGVVVVAAELLGLVGALRFGWLAGLLWGLAIVSVWATRSIAAAPSGPAGGPEREATAISASQGEREWARLVCRWSAVIVVAVVVAQWVLATADSLGGGMFSFDVLWYHMPFAALFAQTASVTHIQFTQADPYVAYYPATSELLNGVGIIAFGNDFLSPLLNVGWLALALAASWSIGRRWRVELLTLTVGAMMLSLPVFSMTQPGEAFNDIVGLATLLTAVALLASPDRSWLRLVAAGTALGLAVGTKYTFVVPALVLVLGIPFITSARRLLRTALVAVPLVLTAGWWYLRAIIHTGSPLGIRTSIGPLHLPGPRSPLAEASQQTVLSQIHHISLWSSRFIPGLTHALGVLWPVISVAWIAAVVLALTLIDDPFLRVLAAAAALSGITYLLFPTGATAIAQSSQLFAVNLRYAVPAITLGLMLVPILVRLRAPRLTVWVAPPLVIIAVAAQLEPNLWPTQTARHIAFLAVSLIVLGAVTATALRARQQPRPRPAILISAGAVLLVGIAAAGFVVQRHYFRERYRIGDASNPGLGAIYGWAQTISHARVALYGTVEQYPLYGAMDSNRVTYLGQTTTDGGFVAIDSCPAWQRALQLGHYQYVVLTPGPTTPIPITWTTHDPDLKPILHPTTGEWVFEITGASPGVHCG
jgi:hypothetical protein